MLRTTPILVALFLSLGLASPRHAAAQQPVQYLFGAGLNPNGVLSTSGQHLFGAVLLPGPSSRVRGRLEVLLGNSDVHGTNLSATANLQAYLYSRRRFTPYALGGVGLHAAVPFGFATNLGLGVETLARARPLFLEARFHAFGTRTAQDGYLALSFGTAF